MSAVADEWMAAGPEDFEPPFARHPPPEGGHAMGFNAVNLLSWAFHRLSLTPHCLSLAFHRLSLAFHRLSLTFRCDHPLPFSVATPVELGGGCSADGITGNRCARWA